MTKSDSQSFQNGVLRFGRKSAFILSRLCLMELQLPDYPQGTLNCILTSTPSANFFLETKPSTSGIHI